MRFFSCFILLALMLNISADPASAHSSPEQKHMEQGRDSLNKQVFWTVAAVQLAGFSTAIALLHQAWYKDYPRSSFHFYNDMSDWLQMDKMGHMVPAYQLNLLSAEAYKLSGLDSRRSAWLGALSSMGFLTAIEMFDGFSAQWGFSAGDMAANVMGSAAYVGQELGWGEQRIHMKWSHRTSGLAKYRPDLLGSNRLETIVKDYNGDTYWISFNIASLVNKELHLPTWLNIAVGYSAYGMLGSSANPEVHNGVRMPDMPRYRQWILSPDIDLSRVQTSNRSLRTIFNALNVIKVPAPAIEYNRIHGWTFHLLYF